MHLGWIQLCSCALPVPGCSQVNLQATEQAGTEYSHGWDIFPAAPFTWIGRTLMAVAGGTICTDFFEVRGYQVTFRVDLWSIDTLDSSDFWKHKGVLWDSLKWLIFIIIIFWDSNFIAHVQLSRRMENPLMGKWEKFLIWNILHFCSLLRNGWGVHAPLCCQLLFCCMCYFTVSSLWWLTETCQLFLISLQAWKSSLEGCV